jgi:hypothetical protein
MLPRSLHTDAFWQVFRRYTGLDHDDYVVGSFGDSPEMATELADLVIAGTKRATASFALRASLAASPPTFRARLRRGSRYQSPEISSSCSTVEGVHGSFGETLR